ncbi:transcription factor E2F7 isoform X5 [Canis lupus familiaris]|uniref:transcription factor E2F7 isoform X5 n=1 Tax=Canis lupus familiaris TaxID=9615 RepID=UPI0018F37E45|nr:transcription factor E2F7 isoform X5 [Canis lupus familiaris]
MWHPGTDSRKQMEVNCLTLKDLINPRQSRLDFAIEDGDNAQKENIFVDRSRMAPKTPIKNEPIDLSKQKIFTPERNPITPVKLVDQRQQTEPWTPTANLKMLISAASPDIRDREKKKGLFRPIENKDDAFTDSLQLDVVGDGSVDEFEKQRPSRKQKSLGLLCQKFLARYPSYPLSSEKTTISLDEVAVSLGVERRRIYDIVNVLESLHLVSRVAKNQYGWHGRHSLPKTLRSLQRLGEEQKYEEQMAHLQQKELELMDYKLGERKKDGYPDSQDQQLLDFSEPDYPSSSANSRKDKSLRIMSQKFVMLFLVSKTKIITLDVAAKILIEESQDTPDHSKFKTKVRRLYDIANVLTSLALIKKVHVTEERGRKPAFKWIGPVDFSSSGSGYSLEIGSLAAVYQQKIEDGSQGKAVATSKRAMPPSGSLDPPAPLPGLSVDSEYCAHPLAHQVFSVAQLDLQAFPTQNSLHGQVGVSAASAASDVESLKPALLASQPLVYVPSPSLLMLYGRLQEGPAPTSGSGVPADRPPTPSVQKRLGEERKPQAEEPAPKRQSRDYEDSPLALVMPKKPSEATDLTSAKTLSNGRSGAPEDIHMEAQASAAEEASGKATANCLTSSEWGNPSRDTEMEKSSKENESTKEPSLLQYLYVQSPAGLNGFNVLLPGSRNPQAGGAPSGQLPPLGIPCMVLPSPTLGPFPVLYSPTVPRPVSSAAGALPDPQLQRPRSLGLSPEVPGPHGIVQPGSPGCTAHPGSAVKPQQCPGPTTPATPVTPRSERRTQRETFFKTPGSLGEPVRRRRGGSAARHSRSAQRRLHIPGPPGPPSTQAD